MRQLLCFGGKISERSRQKQVAESARSLVATCPSPRVSSFVCRESSSVYSRGMATMASMWPPLICNLKRNSVLAAHDLQFGRAWGCIMPVRCALALAPVRRREACTMATCGSCRPSACPTSASALERQRGEEPEDFQGMKQESWLHAHMRTDARLWASEWITAWRGGEGLGHTVSVTEPRDRASSSTSTGDAMPKK